MVLSSALLITKGASLNARISDDDVRASNWSPQMMTIRTAFDQLLTFLFVPRQTN